MKYDAYMTLVNEVANAEGVLTKKGIKFNAVQLEFFTEDELKLQNSDNVKSDLVSYLAYLNNRALSDPKKDITATLFEQFNEKAEWVQTILMGMNNYQFNGRDSITIAVLPDLSAKTSQKELKDALIKIDKYITYLKANIPETIILDIEKNQISSSLANNGNPNYNDYDKALEDLKKMSGGQDDLSRIVNHAKGTKGYSSWVALHHSVQAINSVAKLISSAKWLDFLGKYGVIPVFIIHIIGLTYDIDFHVPSLREDFGTWFITGFAFIIVSVLTVFSHVMSENLINDELTPIVKRVFTTLFLISVISSFYFSWRAITNYTHGVIQSKQAVSVATGNSANSLMANTFQNQINSGIQRVNTINTQLSNNNTRLAEIPSQKTMLNNKLLTAREDLANKIKTIVGKRKQREYINGLETQLASLDAESTRLTSSNTKLQNDLDALAKQALVLAKQQKGALTTLGQAMDWEELQREIFMFILVMVLELISMGRVISMFVQQKNLTVEHHDKLHTLKAIGDGLQELDEYYDQAIIQAGQHMSKKAKINQVMLHSVNKFGDMTNQSQVGTLNMLVENTGKTIEATNEVARLAVEGITNTVKYEAHKQLTSGLQDVILEQSNTIAKLNKRNINHGNS